MPERNTISLREAMVARFLHEMLLFSWVLAFVTGIVIAGASLLG